MYIDRLQLKGFKSFGGTHELILSPGFTAIVGPNGSGKSNLLDALRWSLGDSTASRLRVNRQSGLLFLGSQSREAAKEAEVSLRLREGDKICTIKRRVTAPDGTTSLFVDNERKMREIERKQERLQSEIEDIRQRTTTDLGRSTIVAYVSRNNIKLDVKRFGAMGRKASTLCKKRDIPVTKIHDVRWGQVSVFPDEILDEVFADNEKKN